MSRNMIVVIWVCLALLFTVTGLMIFDNPKEFRDVYAGSTHYRTFANGTTLNVTRDSLQEITLSKMLGGGANGKK